MNLNAEYCKYKYEDKKYTQKNRKCFFKKEFHPIVHTVATCRVCVRYL